MPLSIAGIVVNQQLVGLATAFALITILLWLFNTRSERAVPNNRRSPASIEELGRAVFQVAMSADLEGYRELFLAGGEARSVFGEKAENYLERRALPVLEEALVTISALIPEGSRFVGAQETGPETVAIRVLPPGQLEPILVGIGVVLQVGTVYRIQEPAAY
jgi:hypothetical protein